MAAGLGRVIFRPGVLMAWEAASVIQALAVAIRLPTPATVAINLNTFPIIDLSRLHLAFAVQTIGQPLTRTIHRAIARGTTPAIIQLTRTDPTTTATLTRRSPFRPLRS